MTERSHNTLIMHVQNTLLQCYRSWVDDYLYSDTIPAYHPIQHYLDTPSLGRAQPPDRSGANSEPRRAMSKGVQPLDASNGGKLAIHGR